MTEPTLTVIKKLSEGTYGITRLVKLGEQILVEKKSKNKLSNNSGIEDAGILELGILRNLSHPNIIDIVPPFFKIDTQTNPLTYYHRPSPNNTYSLYLEAMDGDLSNFLKKNVIYQYLPKTLQNYEIKKSNTHGTYYVLDTLKNTSDYKLPIEFYSYFPIEKIKSIIYQLVSAIKYLNCNGIMHSDLKPENILYKVVDSVIIIKITDFGISQQILLPRNNVNCICTEHFKAPECYIESSPNDVEYDYPISLQADMYSLGVNIYAILQACKYGKYSWDEMYWLPIPVSDGWNDNTKTFTLNKAKYSSIEYQNFKQKLATNNQKMKDLINSLSSFEQEHVDIEKKYPFSNSEIIDLKDILLSTLEFDPNLRISSFRLSEHPFFNNSSGLSKHQGGASLVPKNREGINEKFKIVTQSQYNSKYLDTLYLDCIFHNYRERYYRSSLYHNSKMKNLQKYLTTKSPTGSYVSDINSKMLDILYDWLFEVIISMRKRYSSILIPDEVYHLCIHLLRCYILQLSKPILRVNLQGYGLFLWSFYRLYNFNKCMCSCLS